VFVITHRRALGWLRISFALFGIEKPGGWVVIVNHN